MATIMMTEEVRIRGLNVHSWGIESLHTPRRSGGGAHLVRHRRPTWGRPRYWGDIGSALRKAGQLPAGRADPVG